MKNGLIFTSVPASRLQDEDKSTCGLCYGCFLFMILDCSQLFKDACEYQDYPERRCLLRSKSNTPRKSTQRYVYIIGGYDRVEERFLNTVDCYDTVNEMWLNVAPMTTARIRHGVTILDGMIYAVGGQCDDDVSVRTVERYNPVSNKWFDVTPMNECKGK